MDTPIAPPPAGRQRRRHSPEFRASIIQTCLQPDRSIATVALAHGLNASMVGRWVNEQRMRAHPPRPVCAADRASPLPAFVPMAVPATSAAPGSIHIELRRGEATVSVSWPVSAASACAAWLQEWLR